MKKWETPPVEGALQGTPPAGAPLLLAHQAFLDTDNGSNPGGGGRRIGIFGLPLRLVRITAGLCAFEPSLALVAPTPTFANAYWLDHQEISFARFAILKGGAEPCTQFRPGRSVAGEEICGLTTTPLAFIYPGMYESSL